MLSFLKENGGTILVCLILCAVIAGIIRTLLNDRKKGKSFCGSRCAHCPMSGSCHKRR